MKALIPLFIAFLLILFKSSICLSETKVPKEHYENPFWTGSEFGVYVNKKFRLTSKNLNSPVSEFNLVFKIEKTYSPLSVAPYLDIVIINSGPEIKFKGISNSTLPSPIQPEPFMAFWEIRDEKKRVIRLWEINLKPRLERDGIIHYRSHFSLPDEDFAKTFLLFYFVDIDGDRKYEDYLFEFDMRDFDWSKKR